MIRIRSLHRVRGIAAVMLFVWCVATVASWAHACLLLPPASLGSSWAMPAARADIAHPALHHDAAPAPGAPEEPDPARQLCASFCEAEQGLVAKPLPAKGDPGTDPAAWPPMAHAGGLVMTPGRTAIRWRPPAPPWPPGTPLVIAFLRLTL